MPFVQRNWKGEITGVFAACQPGYADEELPEGHPELSAFRAAHPTPPDLLKPLGPGGFARTAQDHKRLRKEHDALREAIWHFNSAFSELEIAFSALLHSALDGKQSRVPYAIYFSPTGFDARTEIVDNAIRQLISEHNRLSELAEFWACIYGRVRSVRTMRNSVAHGMPITVSLRGRNHARLTSPAFDVVRVGRHIETTGQPPGHSAADITTATKKALWLSERLDEVNRLLATFHEADNPTLPEKFAALAAGLQTKGSP